MHPQQDLNTMPPAEKAKQAPDGKAETVSILKKMNKIVWITVLIVWIGFFVWLQLLPGLVKQAEQAQNGITYTNGCLPGANYFNCTKAAQIPQYNGIWVSIGKVLSPYGSQLQIIEYIMAAIVVILFVLLIIKKVKGKKGKEKGTSASGRGGGGGGASRKEGYASNPPRCCGVIAWQDGL